MTCSPGLLRILKRPHEDTALQPLGKPGRIGAELTAAALQPRPQSHELCSPYHAEIGVLEQPELIGQSFVGVWSVCLVAISQPRDSLANFFLPHCSPNAPPSTGSWVPDPSSPASHTTLRHHLSLLEGPRLLFSLLSAEQGQSQTWGATAKRDSGMEIPDRVLGSFHGHMGEGDCR